MQFKILAVLTMCALFSTAVGAVDMGKNSPEEMQKSLQMLRSLKLSHDIEEAGSDTYGVGGNINIDKLLDNKGS